MATYSPTVEAEVRVRAALDEAHEQLAKGWRAHEVAAVLQDAARVIADLRSEGVAA